MRLTTLIALSILTCTTAMAQMSPEQAAKIMRGEADTPAKVDVPDLSSYDRDTLQKLAEGLYQKVAQLEAQVKTLQQHKTRSKNTDQPSINGSLEPDHNYESHDEKVARDILDRGNAELDQRCDELRKKIADLAKSIRAGGKYQADYKLRLVATKKKLRSLIKQKDHYLPTISLEIGAIGVFRNSAQRWLLIAYRKNPVPHDTDGVKVIQVISSDAMIAQAFYKDLWIQGIDTSGFLDDKLYELPGLFQVVGTRTYNTAIGSVRTILEIRPFDVDSMAGR